MDILDELKMLADHIDDENNGKPDALSLQLIGAIAEIRKLRAESERLSSMIDHQRDEAMEMERMLRAELADSQSECGRMTELCRRLYGNLGDVKWCATEDGSQGKGTGRHIACFVLTPNA